MGKSFNNTTHERQHEMNLKCVLCRANFSGSPEQQVALYNAHPCNKVEQLRREQISAAQRRHPSARQHTNNFQSSTVTKTINIIFAITLLFAINWILDTGATHLAVIIAICFSIIAAFTFLAKEMLAE